MVVERHHPQATDRERCEGERQFGGDADQRIVARAIIAREPGFLRATLGEPWVTRTTGQVNASLKHSVFLSDFKKMPTKERDVRKMIAEVEATYWRLRECIRMRELAAMDVLERVGRLRMHEEQKA